MMPPGELRWIMTVIYHDAALLRAWLEHYTRLGVPKFLIGVVADNLVESVRATCRDFDAHVYHFPGNALNIETKPRLESAMRRHHEIAGHDYCIYADLDEFQEYPRHLLDIIDRMNAFGMTCVNATFQDRLAADGSLKEYDPAQDIGEQYPIGTQLTKYLGEEDRKVMLQRGHVNLQATGHHLPWNERTDRWPVGNPWQYMVHHFRWRPGILKLVDQRVPVTGWGNHGPYASANRRLKAVLDSNGGKVRLGDPIVDPIWHGKLRTPPRDIPDPRVPATMKAPADSRNVWRNVILQIKVTNVCDLSCNNCSAGVGLTRKTNRFFMTPDQFRTACRSLQGYRGLVGMFGGNPCLHPQFPELCRIFREEIPCRDQRALWTNRVFNHGAVCRETFGQYQNINLHGSEKARDEFRRDWPEAKILDGSMGLSYHAPLAVSPRDLGYSEMERFRMIGACSINQRWSAAITVVAGQLKAYFCEIAATFAEMYGDPSYGIDPVPGWALRPMSAFANQVEYYCHDCGVPLNASKVADGDPHGEAAVSAKHREVAQLGTQRLRLVQSQEETGRDAVAIKYLPQIG